ncbi:hypothetical protein PG994_000085 [Apiospora phragmitis]|uniref:Transcription factor Iwr1 domain-containing protein n=1 Tax=Apiospora phragmitis TaxID=2905665 RepID=A0ABR1X5A9_9PEZI
MTNPRLRPLQRIPSINSSWDPVSTFLPHTQPQPLAQANRGRRRTRFHKSTSHTWSQSQGSDAPVAGLDRAESAPAVRANSEPLGYNMQIILPQRSSEPPQTVRSPIRPEIQRGRPQRRETPFSQVTIIPETPPSQRPGTRSRGRPITPRSKSRVRSRSRRTILGELSTTSNTANQQVLKTESVRVIKGGFIIKTPSTEQYKYPKATSQPEPVWSAGDGFSQDEAAPDFLFYATGKRKRKRSSTLPRMSKLATETDETGSPSLRPSNKRSRGIGIYENLELLRGGQKEAWPTKADFENCTLSTRSKRDLEAPKHDHTEISIPATLVPQRGRSIDSRSSGEENEEEEMFYEEEDESRIEEGSQVDGDYEEYSAPYASTRASSLSGAYWDEHGNHVFPEDEGYDEYEDGVMEEEDGRK